MVTLFILYLLILIADIACLRYFARRDKYNTAWGFLFLCVGVFIPYLNIVLLAIFIWYVLDDLIDKYTIDDLARKILFIKDKKDDDDVNNFKGKGYR